MARQTAKYVAGLETYNKVEKKRGTLPHEMLYAQLASMGYVWDSGIGKWQKGSTSLFRDSEGLPSGVVRVRIMAHPSEIAPTITRLKQSLNVIEESDLYENRKGVGVRCYLTVKL